MRLKELRSELSGLRGFEEPNIKLEQYPTSPELASQVLFTMQDSFEDVQARRVIDLGCGCGVLTRAAALLECDFCLGVDVCSKALEASRENLDDLKNVDLLQCDVRLLERQFNRRRLFDTAVLNPPFGTKNNQGIDVIFVQMALYVC